MCQLFEILCSNSVALDVVQPMYSVRDIVVLYIVIVFKVYNYAVVANMTDVYTTSATVYAIVSGQYLIFALNFLLLPYAWVRPCTFS